MAATKGTVASAIWFPRPAAYEAGGDTPSADTPLAANGFPPRCCRPKSARRCAPSTSASPS